MLSMTYLVLLNLNMGVYWFFLYLIVASTHTYIHTESQHLYKRICTLECTCWNVHCFFDVSLWINLPLMGLMRNRCTKLHSAHSFRHKINSWVCTWKQTEPFGNPSVNQGRCWYDTTKLQKMISLLCHSDTHLADCRAQSTSLNTGAAMPFGI